MRTSNVDREIVAALTDLAVGRYPDYFDRAVVRAVDTRQRPGWTFPSRWLPAAVVGPMPYVGRSLSRLTWVLLALIVAITLAVGSVVVGSLQNDRRSVIVPPTGVPTQATPGPSESAIASMAAASLPSASAESTAAITGGRFLSTGSLVVARSGHSATLLPDGRVLIAGGEGPHEPHGSNYLDATELWDPVLGTSSASGPLVTNPVGDASRAGMHGFLLPDGRVLVIPAGWLSNPPMTEPIEIWDPATQSARALTTLEIARFGYTAALLSDGRVLIAGGVPSLVEPPTAAAEIWDPVADSILPSGPLAVGREGAYSTLLADGRVLIVGGGRQPADGPADFEPVTAAEIWDPATATFRNVPSLEGVGAAVFGDEQLSYFGGAITLRDGRVLFLDESGARTWDPGTDRLADAGSFLEPRIGYTATLLSDGRVLIVGGEGLRSAELWDPATQTLSSAGTMTEGRIGHTSTALPDGRALIAGGYEVGRDFPNAYPHASVEIWEP